jgi:hypothetical protein
VLSPQITPGSADVLLGFEAAEAMRWRHMLRPEGLVLMNTGRLVPPIVELGLYDYPDDPVAEMRAAGTHVFSFDASMIAQELGDIRLGNTVMLGAISDHLPFPAKSSNAASSSVSHARRPNSSNSTGKPSPPVGQPPKRRRRPRPRRHRYASHGLMTVTLAAS